MIENDEMVPAKFIEAPWKSNWVASGEDVSFALRTSRGDVRIGAETVLTTVKPIHRLSAARAPFPATQQGIAQYRWGSEEAYGMIERSSPLDQPPELWSRH